MISPSEYLETNKQLITQATVDLLEGVSRLKKGQENAAKLKVMADHCQIPKDLRNSQRLLSDFLDRLRNTIIAGVKLQKSGLRVGDRVKHDSWQEPEKIHEIAKDFTLRFKHKKGAFVANNVERA